MNTLLLFIPFISLLLWLTSYKTVPLLTVLPVEFPAVSPGVLPQNSIISTPVVTPSVSVSVSPMLVQKIIRATPKPTPTDKPVNKLFALVNDYRKSKGLQSLVWYPPLCDIASERNQQVKNEWSHNGMRLCSTCGKIGENFAKDFQSPEAILSAWIASGSHKQNLEDAWDWGCTVTSADNYATFVFGKKR